MPIAIIGAGAVGATLGQAWLDHGQDVIWGLRNPVDAGPLKSARLLEPFGMVWIDQAMKRGRGRNFAFALVKTK